MWLICEEIFTAKNFRINESIELNKFKKHFSGYRLRFKGRSPVREY